MRDNEVDTSSEVVPDAESSRTIELPKSELLVQTGVLFKMKKRSGKIIGRHNISELTSVELRTTTDLVAVVGMLFLIGLAAFARALIGPTIWGWSAMGIFGLLALLVLAIIRKDSLRISSRHGHADYDLMDVRSDCEAFVLSLQSLADEARANTPGHNLPR